MKPNSNRYEMSQDYPCSNKPIQKDNNPSSLQNLTDHQNSPLQKSNINHPRQKHDPISQSRVDLIENDQDSNKQDSQPVVIVNPPMVTKKKTSNHMSEDMVEKEKQPEAKVQEEERGNWVTRIWRRCLEGVSDNCGCLAMCFKKQENPKPQPSQKIRDFNQSNIQQPISFGLKPKTPSSPIQPSTPSKPISHNSLKQLLSPDCYAFPLRQLQRQPPHIFQQSDVVIEEEILRTTHLGEKIGRKDLVREGSYNEDNNELRLIELRNQDLRDFDGVDDQQCGVKPLPTIQIRTDKGIKPVPFSLNDSSVKQSFDQNPQYLFSPQQCGLDFEEEDLQKMVSFGIKSERNDLVRESKCCNQDKNKSQLRLIELKKQEILKSLGDVEEERSSMVVQQSLDQELRIRMTNFGKKDSPKFIPCSLNYHVQEAYDEGPSQLYQSKKPLPNNKSGRDLLAATRPTNDIRTSKNKTQITSSAGHHPSIKSSNPNRNGFQIDEQRRCQTEHLDKTDNFKHQAEKQPGQPIKDDQQHRQCAKQDKTCSKPSNSSNQQRGASSNNNNNDKQKPIGKNKNNNQKKSDKKDDKNQKKQIKEENISQSYRCRCNRQMCITDDCKCHKFRGNCTQKCNCICKSYIVNISKENPSQKQKCIKKPSSGLQPLSQAEKITLLERKKFQDPSFSFINDQIIQIQILQNTLSNEDIVDESQKQAIEVEIEEQIKPQIPNYYPICPTLEIDFIIEKSNQSQLNNAKDQIQLTIEQVSELPQQGLSRMDQVQKQFDARNMENSHQKQSLNASKGSSANNQNNSFNIQEKKSEQFGKMHNADLMSKLLEQQNINSNFSSQKIFSQQKSQNHSMKNQHWANNFLEQKSNDYNKQELRQVFGNIKQESNDQSTSETQSNCQIIKQIGREVTVTTGLNYQQLQKILQQTINVQYSP